jgi:hypothetical protein
MATDFNIINLFLFNINCLELYSDYFNLIKKVIISGNTLN